MNVSRQKIDPKGEIIPVQNDKIHSVKKSIRSLRLDADEHPVAEMVWTRLEHQTAL